MYTYVYRHTHYICKSKPRISDWKQHVSLPRTHSEVASYWGEPCMCVYDYIHVDKQPHETYHLRLRTRKRRKRVQLTYATACILEERLEMGVHHIQDVLPM